MDNPKVTERPGGLATLARQIRRLHESGALHQASTRDQLTAPAAAVSPWFAAATTTRAGV
ncbi:MULTISPECIES: hypothetical protein [unclassified Crossiella]|uniref:hypothetical protein n=1 Tax=unclassified Crossiella TaxID=2620835 RepID=UPI001FFFA9A6|nr:MULTISPECIES: hypothetical protein [unclassified Crossiella]MCK2242189.1 hypothetical protein [Crossiella sp. S99.2]MCK2256092.1 hypothetical protein [Crossiella sp. S99.1]